MEIKLYEERLAEIIPELTNTLLGLAGSLALLFLIIGGIYYVVSMNNAQAQTQAKQIITYAVLGLLVIFMSYGLVAALSNLVTKI